MGKVRPRVVKRLAERLVERYGDRFSLSFDENKKLVAELSGLKAKHLRNRVAGYVTRLIKVRMKQQAAEKPAEPPATPSPPQPEGASPQAG